MKNKVRKVIKVNVTSSVPETVKREVKNAWEKIFSSKKQDKKKINTVFGTKKFQKRREKIFQKDNELIKKVSEQEILIYKDTITQLSNGTACGPDNIPNEMIKHMAKSQKFVTLLTKLINICIEQEDIPKM